MSTLSLALKQGSKRGSCKCFSRKKNEAETGKMVFGEAKRRQGQLSP